MKTLCITSLCLGLAALSACSVSTSPADSSPSAPGPAASHDTTPTPSTTSTTSENPPAPPTPTAKTGLRFVNAAFQVGPVDYCVRAKGATTWDGPLLEKLGASDGAAELQQTRLFERDAGDWEVAVVDDQATTCDKPIAQSKSAVTIAPGKPAFAIVYGNGGLSDVAVATIADDSSVASGKSKVRMFYASTGWSNNTSNGSVDVESGKNGLFTGLKYGALATTSSAGTVDAAGYVSIEPTQGTVVVNGLTAFGVDDTTASGTLDAKAGKGTTLVFAGQVESSFFPPLVASCADDVGVAKSGDVLVDCL